MRALLWAAALNAAVMCGVAQAALVDRGGGMVYDTTRNITWLADMNYARTSGYDSDGKMSWTAANTWASALVYGGFDDWRLPTVSPLSDTGCETSDDFGSGVTQYYGYTCSGGELGGLFITELGTLAGGSVLDPDPSKTPEQTANLALFTNVLSVVYWSGTEFAPNPADAWYFNSNDGRQNRAGKTGEGFALAVRDGDVAAAVPEPSTFALAALAMGAVMVVRRRRGR